MNPEIAIVGAGPGGLTLARLLLINGMRCTVFELDKDRNDRYQGGSLDLHEGSAQAALREAGLFDKFLAMARTEGESLKIYEPDGTLLLDESTGQGERPDSLKGRPEVDRIQLRNILIDSLPPETIQWGHKLKEVKAGTSSMGTGGTDAGSPGSTFDLYFEGGIIKMGFDLVIGADGAWSQVRNLLTNTRPFSRESTASTLSSQILILWILISVDGCGINWARPGQAKEDFLDRYYSAFDRHARDLILKADDESVTPRPLYMLPVGHKWPNRQGLTLMGDAAHLMTPFAGLGVNVAMEDALELARALVKCKKNWGETEVPEEAGNLVASAIRAYEEDMFVRAEAYAGETWKYLNLFFNDRGGHAICEHFIQEKTTEKDKGE